MNGKWFGRKKAGVRGVEGWGVRDGVEGWGVGVGRMLSNSSVPDNFTRVYNAR